MKRVVSISLGSSIRDHQVVQDFGGQAFSIERIGTDGDKHKAIQLIRELDGKVDAFGLGGTDLYIYAGNRRYTFRESVEIAAAARISPLVDGSGIKNTLERRVIRFLEASQGMSFSGKKALLVCAVDRFGLAEALVEAGTDTVFGDLLFGLGLPLPLRKLTSLARLASLVAPVITKLPISLFYPTGEQQNEFKPRFGRYFQEADIIAGDFHFIRRYMPLQLAGKMIITNTVTQADVALLKERGIATLVTTTPEMGGRSFGTNILEGVLVTLAGKRPEELTACDYSRILDEIGVEPRVEALRS
ncbi:MAG: quinate 5-dehydrogenase [Negativicutes bacterium]|nr:quinate 5-dehydrogenase [Negativicutes bacterium]